MEEEEEDEKKEDGDDDCLIGLDTKLLKICWVILVIFCIL